MKIKPTLVGFSGELVSMFYLILLKSIKSANSNNERSPNPTLNRFKKPYYIENYLQLILKERVLN